MKAVATKPFVPKGTGQREALCQFRHVPVEGRIKAGDLRQVGKARRHRLDTLDLAGQVQWRKGDQTAQRSQKLGGYALRGGMVRATMDQAMTDRSRLWEVELFQCGEDQVHSCLMVRNFTVRLRQNFFVCAADP